MPLSADGCLVDQTPMIPTDIVQYAPPLYGEHILDQLYADMDQTGHITPTHQSGMNTPFYSQSQSGSSENLSSLNEATHPNGAVPPAALSSRLQNLNVGSRNSSCFHRQPGSGSGGNTPRSLPHRDGEPAYFDQHNNSGQHSNPPSRRTSEEDDHRGRISSKTSGRHTPEHIDYSDLGDLNKVPSYSTAVKTPVRGMSHNDALPNYDAAVSVPPSPNRTFSIPTSQSVETSSSEGSANGIYACTSAVTRTCGR